VIRHVQLRDLGGYISKIPRERHKAAVQAVRRTLRGQGRVIVREEINATQPRPPFDRGEYTRSWSAVPIEDGGRIYSTSPYASVIDRGRRPGFGVGKAGIQALMGWAQRHGLESAPTIQRVSQRQMLQRMLGQRAKNRKADKREQGEASLRSVAFAIAAAIKRRGLWQPKGLRVFERASKRIVDACRRAAKGAIAGAEFQGSHD
jgi:hypothetical protein